MILSTEDGAEFHSLSRGSKSRVLCRCDTPGCDRTWYTQYFHVSKKESHRCRSCQAKLSNRVPHKRHTHFTRTDANKRAISKGVRNSPKFRVAIETEAYRQKMSVRMKKRWQNGNLYHIPLSEEARKKLSQALIGNTNSSGESGGRCKWYEIDNNGRVEKVQGTWELIYAKYLLAEGIEFVAHPSSLLYIDVQGVTRRYFPDFLLIQSNRYVDVKNPYLLKTSEQKLQRILAMGIDLAIVSEEEIEEILFSKRGKRASAASRQTAP